VACDELEDYFQEMSRWQLDWSNILKRYDMDIPDLVGSVIKRTPSRRVCSSMENQSDRHVGWVIILV
jgi:hypothetical protein